jgi:hypothetical protein
VVGTIVGRPVRIVHQHDTSSISFEIIEHLPDGASIPAVTTVDRPPREPHAGKPALDQTRKGEFAERRTEQRSISTGAVDRARTEAHVPPNAEWIGPPCVEVALRVTTNLVTRTHHTVNLRRPL